MTGRSLSVDETQPPVFPGRHGALPGPNPTPEWSPIPGDVAVAVAVEEGELNGKGGGPITWDTRRDAAGEFDTDGGAAGDAVDGAGRGRGDGGTEFKSGAIVCLRPFNNLV
jgi:hypothetical protein